MKQFILDTDMGVDCDDAVALALLLNYKKSGECNILGITASSTREGATATIRTICEYYGEVLPVGAMAFPALECDMINNYGKYIKAIYGAEDETADAICLMRKLLSEAKEKADIIAIGPLTNIARLMRSAPDEISALNGLELVREKVGTMYVMGGRFEQNYESADWTPCAEWNILQDVEAAKYVTEQFPCTMLFCPHESGERVLTEMQSGNNPVWACMKQYAVSEKFPYEPTFSRSSWDPITCLCAMEKESRYFDRSAIGKIRISDDGISTFTECEEGNTRILRNRENYRDIAELINGHVEPLPRETK